MERYFFYKNGLKNYDFHIFKEEIFSLNNSNISYHVNHESKKFYKKIENDITKLNFNEAESFIEKSLNDQNYTSFLKKIYTVDINGMPFQFEVDKNELIHFYIDINLFSFKVLPDFIKIEHLSYVSNLKGWYDIQWVGEHYQAEHYLTKFYFLEPCIEKIKSQIEDFESILEHIPINSYFYKNLGYEIDIVKSNEHYQATFPYSFNIHFIKENKTYQPNGISNVFEVEEDAYLKAIYYLWMNIFTKEGYKTNNEKLKNIISMFMSFIEKHKH